MSLYNLLKADLKHSYIEIVFLKYLNQNSQIRAYPRNLRHPRSLRFDEYYFINQTTTPKTQPIPYPAVTSAHAFMKSPHNKLNQYNSLGRYFSFKRACRCRFWR